MYCTTLAVSGVRVQFEARYPLDSMKNDSQSMFPHIVLIADFLAQWAALLLQMSTCTRSMCTHALETWSYQQ